MQASIQQPGPTCVVQPPDDVPSVGAKLCAGRDRRGAFVWLAWLAAALFLWPGAGSARAQGIPPGCTGSAIGISLFTSAPDVHIGDTLFYSISVFNGLPGNPVSCDASNIIAWITTPDGKTNFVTLRRTYLNFAQSDFYTNIVSYVVRAQDIRTDGTVRTTADDTAVIYQNDTPSTGGANQGVNTEVSLPCIQITAQCTGGIGENGAITFTGTVKNCGNNTLTNLSLINFVDGTQLPVTVINNLRTNQTATFSGSWVLLNPCGPSTATLVIQAVDQFTSHPRTVTNSVSTTCSEVLTAGINVTKLCPPQPVGPGQLLTFSGSVSNTGNVTLTNVVVVNNQPAANTPIFTVASLAPGAVANFTGSYLAPTNCTATDTLTATATSRCGVGVSSVASATCPLLTTPQIAVTAVCPAAPLVPGGSLTYSGTVRNTGNITLANVVVVSDRPAGNTTVFTAASLAPGASANFTGTYTVPTNVCSVTTTFTGSGKDSCALNTVTNSVLTTCTVTTAPAIAVTLACPATSASAGGLIIYTGTVRNSGNVTLNNVFVVNSQPTPGTAVIGPLTLAPGAVSNFTTSFTAPGGSCTVSSSVTATGNDNCTAALVSNTATATCSLITTPLLALTQNCPTNVAAPGGLLMYSGSVQNAGNVTLTNVVILNNASGATPIFTAATLVPGEVANFTGSYLAPTNCSSTSTSTATARSVCGIAVTNKASTTCTILTAPQIVVTATCPSTTLTPGGSLTYGGTVRNAGNITLTGIVVVSDRPVANTTVFTAASLAPGVSVNFTGTYTVPAGACTVTTTFTGTAKDSCSLLSVSNAATTTCTITTAPAIVVKLACPAVAATAGGLIIYTGIVTNSGNVTLNNVTVFNNQASPGTVLTLANLAPHASANFTASFVAPIDACSVTSTVIASGNDNCTGTLVSNTSSATCSLITTPAIVVTQNCPTNPAVPGGLLIYTGTVANAGNITLTNVTVVNNISGAAPIFTVATLPPGAQANFTGSYSTPTNCSSTSTLTATGRSVCGIAVTNKTSATCSIFTTPAIVVIQTCPANSVLPGGLLTYSGIVSNAGNITLTGVVVVSDRPAANTTVFTAASLAPGATARFSGSYQVPSNCCVVSSTVQASGQGCAGLMVMDTDTRTCTVLTLPKIVVTKICAPGILPTGGLQTYSGSVSNAGNITLINVTATSVLTSNGAPIIGPLSLAPGESINYTASYVVTPDFCGSDTVTASSLNVCTFLPVVSSVTTTCPVITSPRITVTKNCPLLPTPRGGLYTYTGSVANTGDVTLLNVFVVDNQPSNNTAVIGPITLPPGASVDFTNSYTAPTCCCLIIDTLTARGQDRCSGSNVTATSTAVCPLLSTPRITVVSICPPLPVPVGGIFAYSGSVSNAGDVVLTNVFVVSSQPNVGTVLLAPVELAPGEVKMFGGSYVVTANSDPASDVVTAQGTDTCQGQTVTAAANCAGPLNVLGPLVINSVSLANGLATITWTATPGVVYTLQSKTNLSDRAWISLPGNVTATGNTASKSNPVGNSTQRLYRVIVAQ